MENKSNNDNQTESIKDRKIGFIEEVSDDILEDIKKIPKGINGLVIIKGPNVGEKFLLKRSKFIIGRSTESDIILDDVTVSRKHAVIEKAGDKYKIRDTGSLNGSYINGEIVDSAVLENDDKIQIGKYIFLFFSSK